MIVRNQILGDQREALIAKAQKHDYLKAFSYD